MTIARTLVLPMVLIWVLTGCGSRTTSDKDLVLVDVAEAIDVVEGRKKLFGLAGNATGTFVDPRSKAAYADGHIPGAVSLPFQIVSKRHDMLKGYDVLVIYGSDYNDDIAEGMSKRLLELGFRDVRTLRGGIRAWKAAGHDLDMGDAP